MQRKKPLIVRLGSAGYHGRNERSQRWAMRFKGIDFLEVDLKKINGLSGTNIRQRVTDFRNGIIKLRNNSVAMIESDMALGIYGKAMITDAGLTPRSG
ncbi:MAG: hypothetical protein HOE11_02760 [Candidatus Diapherotrites archaeon]|jgi:hypothetical protein|nr:hypothetical protein [Candidatus Diapherotrites archaeon]MBT4597087.1 hypothetical protein [Candidatus Diapherotrites archaeon]